MNNNKIKNKVAATALSAAILLSNVAPVLAGPSLYKNPTPDSITYEPVTLEQSITKDNGDGTFDVTAKVLPNDLLNNANLSLEIMIDVDKSGSMSSDIAGINQAIKDFVDKAIVNNPNKNVKIGFVGYSGAGVFEPSDDPNAILEAYAKSEQNSSFQYVPDAINYLQSSSATNKVFIEISDAEVSEVNVNIPADIDAYGILTQNGPRSTMGKVVSSDAHIYDATGSAAVTSAFNDILEKSIGGVKEDVTSEATFTIPDGFELVGTPSASKGNADVNGDSISWSGVNLSKDGTVELNYTIKRTEGGDYAPINSTAKLDLSDGGSFEFPVPEIELQLIPSISVSKTADKTTVKRVGDEIKYEVVITNDGESELSDITVEDSLVPELAATKTTLAPGESDTITYSYTADEDDFDLESIDNTITVTAKDPKGKDVSATDAATVGVEEILGSISFTKVGFDNEPLAGVTFTLKNNETGETQEVVTDEDGVVNYTGLKLGDYTVSETAINNLVEAEDLEATLTKTDFDKNLGEVVNDKATIDLVKLGEASEEESKKDEKKELKSDDEEVHEEDDVVEDEDKTVDEEEGAIEEESTNTEAEEEVEEEVASKSIFAKIVDAIKPKAKEQKNDDSKEESKTKKESKVEFTKKLPDVKFELADGDDVLLEVTTDDKGVAKLENIPVGKKLTLKEVETVEGYQELNNDINFTIDREGNIVLGEVDAELNGEVDNDEESVIVTNYLYEVSDAIITKIDSETKNALEGAEFSLYLKGEKEPLEKAESDKNGKVHFESIEHGDYVVKETKAPEGYEGTDKEFEFTVDPYKEETFEETFENDKIVEPENPYKKVQTGDDSTSSNAGMIAIAGILLIGGTVYYIGIKNKKEEVL